MIWTKDAKFVYISKTIIEQYLFNSYMLERISSVQVLESDIQTVWEFISAPGNLSVITPPAMSFKVVGTAPGAMYPGQFIEYEVKPLAGIKTHWVTEITHVRAPYFFVDEQRKGPYAIWHHQHFLKEVSAGVEMTDLVHYQAPYGPLGSLLNSLIIKKRLREIFDYRFKKMHEVFPKKI